MMNVLQKYDETEWGDMLKCSDGKEQKLLHRELKKTKQNPKVQLLSHPIIWLGKRHNFYCLQNSEISVTNEFLNKRII